MTIEGPPDQTITGVDALLCFDLYAASRAVTAAYRSVLAETGLTYPQYLVLTVLWSDPTCTVRQLADRLQLDHATLTPLLRRMEQTGLVVRRRGDVDGRTVVVSLGEAGEELRPHGARIQAEMTDAMGLSRDQVATLRGILRPLMENLGRPRTPPV
ncbi:MarR family winged helix-turn-helix transcriptional regulator [Solicola sp. PLA-1-18]|uniref:MarR family winged helix-turn-helix transcriptional regulator n=1 Tax=Solicola sp. PLA-1-18 TaxID=3380532 RepID=UPI003B79D17C